MALTTSLPRLAYTLHGAGPPLVLVTGIGGVQAGWLLTVRDLVGSFRILTFDHRGLGASPMVDEPMSTRGYAADLVRLLDEVGMERASFVGFSFGGRVVQELALGWPDRVDRIVLSGTSPGGRVHRRGDPIAEEALTRSATLDEAGWWERAIPAMFGRVFRESQGDRLRNLARWWARHPPRAEAIRRQWEAYAAFDAVDRLERLRHPVLVAHGTDDRLSPRSNAEALATRLPAATLVWLEGVGHAPNVEAPTVFHGLVRDFMLQRGRFQPRVVEPEVAFEDAPTEEV